MIDYAKLKEGMRDAGYDVSAGDEWTAADQLQYKSYVYLNQTNLSLMIANKGQAYTGLLPHGFPGTKYEPGPGAVLESIEIGGLSAPLSVGEERTITVIGFYDDGGEKSVADEASYTSDDETVATVAAAVVTGVKGGTATITATVDGISGTADATVVAQLVSIELQGDGTDGGLTAVTGDPRVLTTTAIGTYDDGTTADLSSVVEWTISDPTMATGSGGQWTLLKWGGEFDVTAKLGDISETVTYQITDITEVTVGAISEPCVVGDTHQMVITSPVEPVEEDVVWTSSDPEVASVSATGLVSFLSAGTFTITCDYHYRTVTTASAEVTTE